MKTVLLTLLGFIWLGQALSFRQPIHLQQTDEESKQENGEQAYIPRLPLYIGRSYNIFEGNPLSNKFDPGFRHLIFQYSFELEKKTLDGKYVIPDRVSSRLVSSCSFSSSVNVFTGTQSYSNDIRTLTSLSVGAGFDKIAKFAFSLSTDYRKIEQETSDMHKTITQTTATCEAYGQSIDLFDIHPLLPNFIKGVNESYHERDWSKFIGQFGTHFTYEVILGSRAIQQITYSNKSIAKLGTLDIDIKGAAQASFADKFVDGAFNIKGYEKSKRYCEQLQDQKLETFIGGKPPKNGSVRDWAINVAAQPMPISYKLMELSALFKYIKIQSLNVTDAATEFAIGVAKYCQLKLCRTPTKDRLAPPPAKNIYHRTPEFGGWDGRYFDSLNPSITMQMKKVLIRSAKKIDMLQLMLSDGVNSWYTSAQGGEGGEYREWVVPEGERVTQFEIRYGGEINSLTFITNKGNKSPRFGDNNGEYRMISIPDGFRIVGFSGRSEDVLVQLSFTLAKTTYPRSESK